MSAWQPQDDYEAVWTPFDRRFNFRPSTVSWPAFLEPPDSMTYHIGHVYGDPDRYTRLTLDLSHKLVAALRRCIEVDDFVNVLNWQHPSFRFWPHAPFEFASEDDWPIPALPSGDYHIFIDQTLRLGVLGHPWEQTMCVFGRPLLDAFENSKPTLFDRPIRVGGEAV